jgi:hypothetical protein
MILLAFGVAILDEHTRLAHLETNASLLAALGTAAVYHHSIPNLIMIPCDTT